MSEVFVIDDLPPEAVAMLQALYSRSPKSVQEHLEHVKKVGADKFMAQFYCGYGHKSIGDCGSISIFIENVSMLAAKAIQDWPLYSGQEASTRYLDMASQAFLNPERTDLGREIQDAWRDFYSKVLVELVPSLKERFPIKEGEKPETYEKAIKAKAFDIARGFLPAGAATLVSWHTNLRQASDHLAGMRNHPLLEVRQIAQDVLQSLQGKYAASFLHKEYPKTEEYLQRSEEAFAYFDPPYFDQDFSYVNRLDVLGLRNVWALLTERPPKTELHHRLRRYGSIEFRFRLDFGSYRDLQRQRSCIQEMPLLTTQYGFYPWYLEQLPPHLREEAAAFVTRQEQRIEKLYCSPLAEQYYIGMGYTIPVEMVCSLPSAVYIAELRTSDTVHPTLRIQAQRMADAIRECVPGIALHCDMEPGQWNLKRGEQDIVRKPS